MDARGPESPCSPFEVHCAENYEKIQNQVPSHWRSNTPGTRRERSVMCSRIPRNVVVPPKSATLALNFRKSGRMRQSTLGLRDNAEYFLSGEVTPLDTTSGLQLLFVSSSAMSSGARASAARACPPFFIAAWDNFSSSRFFLRMRQADGFVPQGDEWQVVQGEKRKTKKKRTAQTDQTRRMSVMQGSTRNTETQGSHTFVAD